MLDAQQRTYQNSRKAFMESSLRRKPGFLSATEQVNEKARSTTGNGLSRTESLFTLRDQSCASYVKAYSQHKSRNWFGSDVRSHAGVSESPSFDKDLRAIMEPHLRQARLRRNQARHEDYRDRAIGSSAGVPYPSLRRERPFLFDTYSHPMHEILAQTLGVQDLSKLHEHTIQDKRELLSPLLDPCSRRCFHECYDKFVTTFCIPLLHSFAMKEGILENIAPMASSKIVYRYQAFPSIRIVRPGEEGLTRGPQCDIAEGYSIGNLNFHIPLTPTFGTNSLYTESHSGREDWHPLTAKSVGLGYLFDGARCVHFGLENTTPVTRVSIDFRIAIYREDYSNSCLDGGRLCSHDLLHDSFSTSPGFYDEAVVETGRSVSYMEQFVAKKKNPGRLIEPDARVGFPFDKLKSVPSHF